MSAERAGLRVRVDGASYAPEVEGVGPGTFVLKDGARRLTFHCVRDEDTIHLWWEGVAYRLCEEGEGGRAAQRHVQGGLEATMPGRVIAVKVVPGQAVARGEELVVVESMKMETALRAPRDGVVRSVQATVGEMVGPGRVLVELS